LKARDLILTIIGLTSARDEFGRTSLQKVVYFVADDLGLDLEHVAHFFGPYSSRVEQEVEAMVGAGLVRESIQHLGFVGSGGFEGLKYSYELTDAGRKRYDDLERTYPEDTTKVAQFIDKLQELAGSLDQKLLSAAAKTHYISKLEGAALSPDRIRQVAKDFGWQLSSGQVNRVTELLHSLGMDDPRGKKAK
jgi:uncharacterized protein YwgA